MQLTVKFKILPTKEQEKYLEQTLNEYILPPKNPLTKVRGSVNRAL